MRVLALQRTLHPAETPFMRINEVAAETGLTTRAIRYYAEIGLLAPAPRSDGDYRLYDASDLDRSSSSGACASMPGSL